MASKRKVLNKVTTTKPSKSSVLEGEIVISNQAGRETLYILNDRGDIAAIQTGGGEGGNPNSVLFIPQTLTDEEKTQVLQNIVINGQIPAEFLPVSLKEGIVLGENEGDAYEGSKGKKNSEDIESLKTELEENNNTVSLLVGSDSGMTIRQIAINELANQLLTGKADADFKTLQDLANWLEDHPEDVTEINSNIATLSGKTSTLETSVSANTQAIEENNDAISAITENIAEIVTGVESISGSVTTINETVVSLSQEIEDSIKITMPMTQEDYETLKEEGKLDDKTLYIIKELEQ